MLESRKHFTSAFLTKVFPISFVLSQIHHRVGKVRATDPQSHSSNICFTSLRKGGFFINIEQFSYHRLFSFNSKNYFSSFIKHVEDRSIIKFFTWKGLNTIEIRNELDECRRCTVVKCFAQFKHSQRAFEDSPRTRRTSTITINQNIQALQRIGMCNRQISVRRLPYELPIPTTTVYEIISNHLGMKKVSTGWVSNTYSTLSRESEGNPNNYFHRIVTADEIWLYYEDSLSQEKGKWRKSKSTSSNKVTWKDHHDHFMGQIWYSADRMSARRNYDQRSLLRIELCCTIVE